MSKIKLNKVLFEYMEGVTNKNYNYLEFVQDLRIMLRGYENIELFCHDERLKEYLSPKNREETFEKLVKAFVLGYEEESETYTIVLFERNGFRYVIWDVDGEYEVSEEDDYIEMEGFRKSFTMEEIKMKFPQLVYLAQKNK